MNVEMVRIISAKISRMKDCAILRSQKYNYHYFLEFGKLFFVLETTVFLDGFSLSVA